MRKLSANYIFDGRGNFLKNAILILDDDNSVLQLIDTKGNLKEENNLEFYNGIITPGFINSHCHIELSHLKDSIIQKTKLPTFLQQVLKLKQSDTNKQINAIKNADELMQREGIVAVGDISNTDRSFEIKSKSNIIYHTFLELVGPDKTTIDKTIEFATDLKQKANNYKLKNNYVPHATYSVSDKLLKFITDDAYKTNSIISIHNQETESENEMFIEGKGELLEGLKEINSFYSNFKPTHFNSLPSTLVHLPKCNKTMMVHNTYTTPKDICWVNDYTKYAYWCLCPNSNLFIEGKLPNIDDFIDEKVCLGTDSFASNKTLSIIEEIKTINKNFPNIPLSKLLTWATYNGAEALDLHFTLGSFEKTKKPGVNLIENIDFDNMKLKKDSKVRKLL